jgi:hypothetical protein
MKSCRTAKCLNETVRLLVSGTSPYGPYHETQFGRKEGLHDVELKKRKTKGGVKEEDEKRWENERRKKDGKRNIKKLRKGKTLKSGVRNSGKEEARKWRKEKMKRAGKHRCLVPSAPLQTFK